MYFVGAVGFGLETESEACTCSNDEEDEADHEEAFEDEASTVGVGLGRCRDGRCVGERLRIGEAAEVAVEMLLVGWEESSAVGVVGRMRWLRRVVAEACTFLEIGGRHLDDCVVAEVLFRMVFASFNIEQC